MKLMLTSHGLRNDSIRNALKKLVGEDVRIAVVSSGMNMASGTKEWFIDDLNDARKAGSVDIVDVTALPKDVWLPRLERANVIFMEGGNTCWLMECIIKSGLVNELENLLETRVYVGASAGSIVLSKSLFTTSSLIEDEKEDAPVGLGFVDFYFRPHFNSPNRPKFDRDFLKRISEKFDIELYALDDESAIVWIDGEVEVVSEGEWVKFEGKKLKS